MIILYIQPLFKEMVGEGIKFLWNEAYFFDPGKVLPLSRHPELLELAEGYEPEEFTILAVTRPKGFTHGKFRGQELWKAGTNLTAWRKENEAIQTEKAYLETMADDDLIKRLSKHAPGDSVIRVRVRQSRDGKRFMVVGMPARAADAELQAILEEAKKPVSFWKLPANGRRRRMRKKMREKIC